MVAADVAWTLAGGTSLMFEYGPRGSRSILVHAAGDVFRHRPLADVDGQAVAAEPGAARPVVVADDGERGGA